MIRPAGATAIKDKYSLLVIKLALPKLIGAEAPAGASKYARRTEYTIPALKLQFPARVLVPIVW
jgi:hypothetical protein